MARPDQIVNPAGEIVKAGCVVVGAEQKVLLVTNADRTAYGLPKGHCEGAETPPETARREVREETGYGVRLLRVLPDLTYLNGRAGEPIRVHYFLAEPLSSSPEGEPETAIEWVEGERALAVLPANEAAIARTALCGNGTI